jgi:hypothetical protein
VAVVGQVLVMRRSGAFLPAESSPSAEARSPSRNFIKYCKTMTVLDAWKKANKRIK